MHYCSIQPCVDEIWVSIHEAFTWFIFECDVGVADIPHSQSLPIKLYLVQQATSVLLWLNNKHQCTGIAMSEKYKSDVDGLQILQGGRTVDKTAGEHAQLLIQHLQGGSRSIDWPICHSVIIQLAAGCSLTP